MNFDIDRRLNSDREMLLSHPLFSTIRTIEDVRTLMEAHVYAVWDFMTLLKRIQRDLTCVDLPWMPPKHPTVARLINEIVIGEESDVLPGQNGFLSHLELYLEAMSEVGADTSGFRAFMGQVENGVAVPLALERCQVPDYISSFVNETMGVAQHGSIEQVLAYFFFGREDIIPDMFSNLLKSWAISENAVPLLTYYLKRHIELDGDDHGPAAKKLIGELLISTEQRDCLIESAKSAIKARIRLWDGVMRQLSSRPIQREDLVLTAA